MVKAWDAKERLTAADVSGTLLLLPSYFCRPSLSGDVPCHVNNPRNGATDILSPGRQDIMKPLSCKE